MQDTKAPETADNEVNEAEAEARKNLDQFEEEAEKLREKGHGKDASED